MLKLKSEPSNLIKKLIEHVKVSVLEFQLCCVKMGYVVLQLIEESLGLCQL